MPSLQQEFFSFGCFTAHSGLREIKDPSKTIPDKRLDLEASIKYSIPGEQE